MQDSKSNKIPAVDKTISLLECLGNSTLGMTQAELCQTLNITQSTCYRIIQTLLEHRWICKTGKNLYDLAPRMLSVTSKLNDSSRRFEQLQPQLRLLARQTGLSCKLSIRRGSEQLTVLREESPLPMSISGKIGATFPVIEGSVGAVLLSDLPREEIMSLISGCPEELEEKRNPKMIFDRLQQLESQGYCYNSGNSRWKVGAMSSPVLDRDSTVAAALTLLGFGEDFAPGKIEHLGEELRKATQNCGEILASNQALSI
jgi:DNA-binding IclR family transcriptional regulator